MSIGVEFYQQQAGAGPLKADYLEGEDAWRPPAGLAFRDSLVHPADRLRPSRPLLDRYFGPSDGGGVHPNSSIANHAFYLAVEGGKNATSGLSVTGVGAANRDKVEKVFFRGFTTLTANATFSLARAKTIQAARDLYGAGSAVETPSPRRGRQWAFSRKGAMTRKPLLLLPVLSCLLASAALAQTTTQKPPAPKPAPATPAPKKPAAKPAPATVSHFKNGAWLDRGYFRPTSFTRRPRRRSRNSSRGPTCRARLRLH